ncbi:MAG: hypothetical protein K2Q03_03540 [Sphingobacteriaceae bacterium]|nr:hypothetical protein [Sphingobacteriaceae bacterium]
MYKIPVCKINIGKVTFNSVHDVRIDKSIHNFMDTARIKIPTSARLRTSATDIGETVQVAQQFKEGDFVQVNLGYNPNLKNEFVGFVRRINFATPLEIECEGYSYQLRKKTITKQFVKSSLKEILNELIKGTDIILHKDVPDMPIDKVIFRGLDGAEALRVLKDKYLVNSFFIDNVLYAGLLYVPNNGKVKYEMYAGNVVDADSLKYRLADEVKVKIKAIHIKPNGQRVEASVGEDGGVERTVFLSMTDKTQMQERAKSLIKDYQYSGYEGKIKTFLIPKAVPGMIAEINDSRYKERTGAYYIESVLIEFGTSGARRVLEIGVRANKQK